MGFVVGDLLGPPPVGLVDRLFHRVGHPVGIHVDFAGHVAGGAADGLDQAARRAQETLFVGVEDRDKRHLWQVQALSQQVDPDEHVVVAQPQLTQKLHPPKCVDFGVQVAHPDTQFQQIVGEVLGHLLGQRRHQDPLVRFGALADLADQIVDLALGRLHHDFRVDQTGRANHLLDELPGRLAQLIGARGRRQVHRLPDPVGELLPGQRPVVGG